MLRLATKSPCVSFSLPLFLFHLCLTPIQNLCVRSTVWTCARMWFYFVCSSFAKTKRKLLLLKWVSWAGAQWRAVTAATSSASHALIYCSANGKSAYSATIELHQFGYLDRTSFWGYPFSIVYVVFSAYGLRGRFVGSFFHRLTNLEEEG